MHDKQCVPAPSIGRRAAVVPLGPKKKHWSNSKAAALRQRSSLSSSSSSIARCLACSACGRLSAFTLGSSCRSRSTSSGAMATSDSSKDPCKAGMSVNGAGLVVAAKARAAVWRPAGPSSVALGGAEKLRGSAPRGAPIRIGAPSAPRPVAKASERPSSKMSGANAQLIVSKPTLIAWRSCSSSCSSCPSCSSLIRNTSKVVVAAVSGRSLARATHSCAITMRWRSRALKTWELKIDPLSTF